MSHVFHRDPRLEYPVAVRGEGAYLYDREGKRYLDASGGAAVSDPKLRMHARVKRKAMQAGLMCYPMGGTLDGVHGDHVLLAPPFIVEEAQLDELVGKLARALAALEEE
jgi:adenosylmethionine-8-amino-7-oxononanoate aminotransferase